MRASLTTTICLVFLAGTVLAGCGNDDDGSAETDSTPASLTRASYIERADAICQELYEQRGPLETQAAEAGIEGDAEAAAQTFESATEITRNRVADLEALPLPEGEEVALGTFIDNARATVPPAEQAVAAIRDQKEAKLNEAAARGLRATNRFNKSAIDYGFLVCGRGAATEIG